MEEVTTMLYENNNIDISLLEQYKSLFEQEIRYYETSTYNIFNSSYLNNCNDVYIKIMSQKLENLYSDIQKGYKAIEEWWSNYLVNARSLESYMSNDSKIGLISEANIRNFVDYRLSTLINPKIEVSNIIRKS